jgi:flagellar basal body rod protein FlgC
MQINNNVNSMLQLEKRLEQSASALSKLNLDNEQTEQKSQKDVDNNPLSQEDNEQETDMIQEMVKQIEIPIAYTANAQIISTQNSVNRTIIDIKA